VRGALLAGIRSLVKADSYLTTEEQHQLDAALQGAEDHPADPERLAQLAPDATAPSALLGGVHVAAFFPGRDQVGAALRFAAGAPDGDSVACTTGALLGAAHCFEALPVDLVSRHELAWVLDSPATWSSHTDVATTGQPGTDVRHDAADAEVACQTTLDLLGPRGELALGAPLR
jgi:hypothetical protein